MQPVHPQGSLQPLRLGWIPYWNLAPLRVEMQKTLGKLYELELGHPTTINGWLSKGTIEAAPCSSICLLRESRHEMALPLGICSTGPVRSVYLGFREELAPVAADMAERIAQVAEVMQQLKHSLANDPREIAKAFWRHCSDLPSCTEKLPAFGFTPHSASSATLARMFYRIWFGAKAFEGLMRKQIGIPTLPMEDSEEPQFELLIGDEALRERHRFHGVFDLGELWQQLTGLPFVFAVWQGRKPLNIEWQKRLLETAHLAQMKMRIDANTLATEIGLSEELMQTYDLKGYWESIRYSLTADDMQGLLLFLYLAGYFSSDQMEEHALTKMMRWQANRSTHPGLSLIN